MTTSSKTNMKPKLSKTGTTNKSNAVDGTTRENMKKESIKKEIDFFDSGYQKGYRNGKKAGLLLFSKRAEKNFDWHHDPISLPPKYERTNWIRKMKEDERQNIKDY